MSDGLGRHGVEVALPVDTNAVFVRLSRGVRAELARTYAFGVWEGELARFMAAWDSTPATVDAFVAELQRAVSATRLEV
jgi:threonine aldolase